MSEETIMTHSLRERMRGFSDNHDRLWKITKPAEEYFPPFEAGITDYNFEITGFTMGLPEGLRYGGNVGYWLEKLAKDGYTVEHIDDRK